uniref:Uncharacterized protein n=1 Tax=Cannabis sativa TaxID=3483 RepID=A0A803NY99_CANSA
MGQEGIGKTVRAVTVKRALCSPPPPVQSPPPPSPPKSPPPPASPQLPSNIESNKSPPPPINSPHRHPFSHKRKPPPPPPPHEHKINAGKKIGLLFSGIAAILQIGVISFLVFKRRQLLKVNDRYEACS